MQHDAPEEPSAKRQRTAKSQIAAAENTSASIGSSTGSSANAAQVPKKRWIARGWHAKQYFELANAAWENFPFDEFEQKHQKTRSEVWDVFNGIIRLPTLQHAWRKTGVPRGGLGEARMKELRSLEKEGKKNMREEDERQRKHDIEDEKLDKNAKPEDLVCKKCKIQCTRRPASVAQAEEDVYEAIKEFNRRAGVMERMRAKAKENEEEDNE